MTRKDYVLLSTAIAAARANSRKTGDDRNETAYLIGYLQVALKNENPRFDADAFNDACRAKDDATKCNCVGFCHC